MSQSFKPFRLGVLFTHPTQHHSLLWRRLSEESDIEITVMYLSAQNTIKGSGDRELGATEPWDVDLIGGYKNEFLKTITGKVSPVVKKKLIHLQLIKRLNAKDFDAVYISSFVTYSHRLAFLLCKLRGIPIISFNDATIITQNGFYTPIQRALLSFVYPILFGLTDFWIVTGDHNEIYLRHYGVLDEKMTRGNFPFDRERFEKKIHENQETVKKIRKQYFHGNDVVLYGFAGKYIERKRPLDFIEAVIKANQKDSRIKGVLIGGGKLESEINKKIDNHQDTLVNVGFVNQSQLPLYYGAMDVFVSASSIDPHPLVVSEAMAAGCPVILSDRCANWGYSDVLQHRYNGLVYPCGNIDKLADAMITLSDSHIREQYAKRAKEVVATQDLDSSVSAFLSVIEKIRRKYEEKLISLQ